MPIGAPADLHCALTHPASGAGRFVAVATYAVDVEQGLDDVVRTEIEGLFDQIAADGIVIAAPIGPSGAAQASAVALAHGRAVWAVMPTESRRHAARRRWPRNAGLLQITGHGDTAGRERAGGPAPPLSCWARAWCFRTSA